MASSPTVSSTPALTTLWTSPDSCSASWTYYKYTGTYYTYISQFPGVTTKDVPCRVPGWGVNGGTFSPGVCPYLWTTWTSTVISGSITSAQCCPSGYINQFSDCASLYAKTLSSVLVYSSDESSSTVASAPPGTAVVSAVHVLHQASDLSILPAPVSALASTGASSTTTSGPSAANTSPANSPSSTAGASSGSKPSTGAIVGIVIGSVVGAVLIVAGAWYVWLLRRRLAGQKRKKDEDAGGVVELHGEDCTKHELVTQEKAGELSGSHAAVEMPNTGVDRRGGPRRPAELEG